MISSPRTPFLVILSIAMSIGLFGSATAMDLVTGRQDAQAVLADHLAMDDADIQARTLEQIGASGETDWGTQAILSSGVLDSGTERVVARALVALGMLGSPDAVPALLDKAGSGDSYMAAAAAEGLTWLLLASPGVSADVAGALNTLADHDSALVRIAAASALGMLQGSEGVAKLISIVESDESSGARRSAAAGLSMHGDDPTVVDALVRLTGSASLAELDPAVAEMVVLALGFATGEKRDEAMTNAISALSSSSGPVRLAAISAASQLATPENSADQSETVSRRSGVIGGDSSRAVPGEADLLDALALRLALLSGVYDYVIKADYPQYFSDLSEEATVETDPQMGAAEDLERGVVAGRAGFSGLPEIDDEARALAEAALETLRLRASRALMETALYKARDVESPAVRAAMEVERLRKDGSVEKSGVTARLEEYVAGLQETADARTREYRDGWEKLLGDLQIIYSGTDQHWDSRIHSAGRFLELLNSQ